MINVDTNAVSAPAGGTPGTTGTSSTGTPSVNAPAQSTDWTTGFNEDTRGYVQNKGFKDASAVVESYRNLEKLRGVPEERLLRLPEKEDDADGWKSVYGRLGRPEKAEDYKIQTGDPEFGKWAQGTFHELGLSAKQAEALVGKFNEYNGNVAKTQTASYSAKIEQEAVALKTEWGAAHEQNTQIAKRAAGALGVSPDQIDALEKAMGYAGVMKFMHSLGAKLGEGSFVTAEGKSSSFSGAMTPDAASQRIRTLRADPAFVQKYIAGDASSREEMEKLHRFAYPEQN